MKKILWILVAVALVGWILYGNIHSRTDKSETGKPLVKIGAILPLTGNMGYYGNAYRDMYLLRMKQIPKDSKYEYKLIIEDDEMQTSKSITAAQKLFNLDNIDILLGGCSGAEPSIADTAKQRDKVMFSLLWDEETPLRNRYLFNILPLPDQYIPDLLKEMRNKGIKTLSVVLENHKGALQGYNVLKENAPKYGIKIIDTEYIDLGERDFKIIVLKMAKKKPDMYLVPGSPISCNRFVEELKKQGIKTPITSITTLDYIENKKEYEGTWYVSDGIINSELSEKYQKEYSKELFISQVLWGYVALDSIINAYEQFDTKPTAEQLIQKLHTKRTNTAVGEIEYKGNGILHGNGIMKVIKDGKSVKLED